MQLTAHHYHKSGEAKTVCVSACLGFFGIHHSQYHYTGKASDNRREAILRKFGYAVRSRKSAMGKASTIGQVRDKIKGLKDREGTHYLVIVYGRNYCHAMVLDGQGQTVVDTDARKRDKRKVLTVKAVWKA